MSSELPIPESHDCGWAMTSSISDRAALIAVVGAGCFALVAGTSYLIFVERINGFEIDIAADALIALLFFGFPTVLAAVLGTAILMKRWSRELWLLALYLFIWLSVEIVLLDAIVTRLGCRLV